MRPRALHLLVCLALTCSARVAWADAPPPRLWILPFQQLEADAALAHLREGLPALLAVAVSRSNAYAIVDRRDVNHLLAEQSLTLEGLTAPATRHRIGRLLGATVMITGRFVPQGSDLVVTLRATDLETGITTVTADARGPAREPGKLASQLYRQLADRFGQRLSVGTAYPIDDEPLSNLDFMKGLGHYYSARYSRALAAFMSAAGDDPAADLARFWIAKTYVAEQQYAHAYLELTRLVRRGSRHVRNDEIAAALRECEKHLRPEDVTLIRELTERPQPSDSPAAPGMPAQRPDTVALVSPHSPWFERFRYFGGRTVTVPLLIHASNPMDLEVRAELVQLTANLSVPIGGELNVTAPSAGAVSQGGIVTSLALTLPAVDRETDFELRFRSRQRGDKTPRAAGRIAMRVYPTELLAPVRAWAQTHRLRVEDDRGALIAFLRRHQIPIADQSGHGDVTLVAGPRALDKHASAPRADSELAVLFTERESEMPYLVLDRTGSRTSIRVETRLLDRLDTDPQAHKFLLEIFHHVRQLTTEGAHR